MRRLLLIAGAMVCLVAGSMAQTSQAPADDQSPALKITSGPRVEFAGTNLAIVAWSTNVSAGTLVHYGTDQNNLVQHAQMPWGALTHRVTLKGLQPNTTYFYQVDSDNAAGSGGQAHSQVLQFQTKDPNASAAASTKANSVRITSGPAIEQSSSTSATVVWSTSEASISLVRFGTDAKNLTHTTEAPWGATTHQVTLPNLKPGTTYYYQVQSAQAKSSGTQTESGVASFQTAPQGQSAQAGTPR
jgi:phosphodiesterase/alkaline phosphatase D-like protein